MGGKAAEHVNDVGIFLGVGGELLGSFRLEEHEGELGGSDLETDLGKLAGVVFAEVIGQVILQEGELELALLLEAPFFIAAASFPVAGVKRVKTTRGRSVAPDCRR